MRIIYFAAISLSLSMVSGCFGGTYVAMNYYTIHPLVGEPSPTEFPVALGIRSFSTGSSPKDQIMYKPTPFRVEYFEYQRWAEMPSEMMTNAFLLGLRKSQLFRPVSMAQNMRFEGLVLDGELLNFEVAKEQGQNRAICRVYLEIRTTGEEKLAWAGELSDSEPCSVMDKESVAKAMSEAVNRIVNRLIQELGKNEEVRHCVNEMTQKNEK